MKERKRRPPSNFQSFYIQIKDSTPDYTFSLNGSKLTVGPYWEHLETTLMGTFLWPDRVKGLQIRLVFMGLRDHQSKLEQPIDSDWKPRNVGVLTLRGKRREFLGSLPYDALWGLLHAFSSGALRIAHLYGILERGRAEIHSVNFARDVDPDELRSESTESDAMEAVAAAG
jgi:hypothetical protein